MAQIDEEQLQITLGIVGVGSAPVDFLIHQGRKMGLDRELLEAVPVVRFGLRGVVLERKLVVVMSSAPLDVIQADAVIAVDTGEAGLDDLLHRFDLLPVDPNDVSSARVAGAGRAQAPLTLLVTNVGAASISRPGFANALVDLHGGDGISKAVNAIVSEVATLLASGARQPRPCPTLVLHATHHATTPEDLQPATFPRPGARLVLEVSLHEPFGDPESRWSCTFTGAVDAATGPHTVEGTVRPAGAVPKKLDARWRVAMIREHEIWILRSMIRD